MTRHSRQVPGAPEEVARRKPVQSAKGVVREGAARSVGAALELQHTAGNRATAALLATGQAKLMVSAAGDRYEQEAEAIAAEVVSRLSAPGAAQPDEVATELDEDTAIVGRIAESVRRSGQELGAAGGELDEHTEATINRARRNGSALPGGVRRSMERAFGADFADVRVHTGPSAESLNRQVGAVAFTVGSDIFLGRSAPGVSSQAGQGLLAHELVHTIQQGGARAKPEETQA